MEKEVQEKEEQAKEDGWNVFSSLWEFTGRLDLLASPFSSFSRTWWSGDLKSRPPSEAPGRQSERQIRNWPHTQMIVGKL